MANNGYTKNFSHISENQLVFVHLKVFLGCPAGLKSEKNKKRGKK